MDNEKMILNLAQGANEVIIREGNAPDMLPIKAPVKTDIHGTIGTVAEYLSKRIDAEQFFQEDCHIKVNRENVTITLVINEADPYKRGEVSGKLQFHPAFKGFGINGGKVWTPVELGMHVKMNRAFFTDKTANMNLVSTLMHFTADVNNKIDRQVQENGNRTDNFAQVVNSNLPEKFALHIPIFKGEAAEDIEVETFAQVNGREVAFVLLSPGAKETLETIRDNMIDKQLAAIKEIAPNIAIIEE